MFREYGATNAPHTCVWCGRKLRRRLDNPTGRQYGDYGDGLFCGLRCGFDFALRVARLGHRFEPGGTSFRLEP